MANRTRPIRIEFCVSDYEHRLIKNKMAQLGTHNMGAYLHKMAIDGYIIKVDYTEQKSLPPLSAEQLPTSTTSADASTRPAISMQTMWLT